MQVSIVSSNPETLDALQEYLRNAGVTCHTARAIRDLTMSAPSSLSSAIIFPDDLQDLDVLAFLPQLRRDRPKLLTVLVTREPNRYRTAVERGGESALALVLPRPSFGWEILDAIRAHADGSESP